MTTSILELILLKIFSQKLADLLHLWLFLQSNLTFYPEQTIYNLGQKPHTFYFFLFFCEEMIKLVYAMLDIAIKDLKIYLNNSNLLIRKSAIYYEFLVQKKKTGK